MADKIGQYKLIKNSRINISNDDNFKRLLDSFHRDKPMRCRGIPKWNQLTMPSFEPLKKASLKHLTFKTVFFLALGSGKRRNKIHAWLHRNIRHQEDVSLYISPSYPKTSWQDMDCEAPIIIPALAPTLEDRTLCPVRALHYYLNNLK